MSAYQHLEGGTELTSVSVSKVDGETKSSDGETKTKPEGLPEDKKGVSYSADVKVTSDDWPLNVYRPVRSTNWTRQPVKYNPSQQELAFIDRTFCQLIGGGAALVAAVFGLVCLANYPWWVISLYIASIWGLAVGCVWDIYNECVPVNRWAAAVSCYRALNASFVTNFCFPHLIFIITSDYNYIAKSVPLDAWYFVLFMVATYTGVSQFLGHHRGPAPLLCMLLFSITAELIVLISAKVNGLPEYDSWVSFSGWILLLALVVLSEVAMLVAVHLPLYHALLCICFFMLTFAVMSYGEDFCFNTLYGTAQPNFWYIFLGFVVGLGLVFLGQPLQRNVVRRALGGAIWGRVWSSSLSLPPWDPVPLSLQKNKNQPFIGTKAFWLASCEDDVTRLPRAAGLCIPVAEFTPISQLEHVDGSTATSIFSPGGLSHMLSYLDARLGQSSIRTALVNKNRFRPGQNGAYWFPVSLGFTGPPPAPAPTISQAKLQGTLLEFLVWYGHLSPALRKVTAEDRSIIGDLEGATHVIDYEWMASLEVKPDFHRCGGRAFFRLDPDPASVRLHVMFLTRPAQTRKIYPLRKISGETDWEFDQAEQILLTSSYVLVVVGYHTAGIHVMLNLLALALHNGFDTNDGEYFHPWRTAMHLHFYNHTVANDSTIGHLLENTALFAQIFPFTANSLHEFLHTVVRNYEYLSDADLEARKAVTDGVMPENATLMWEENYKKIFTTYATMIADVCWKTDADVVNDLQMQKFLRNLASNIPKGLPARFRSSEGSTFTTKAQVVEFTASAIFIVTCRHEVYGTLFWNWAAEPAIMQSQLPLDFGPPAVNDYQAMVGIAVATSRRPATKLMVREEPFPGEKTTVGLPKNARGLGMRDFKYFISELPTEEDAGLKKAFDYLQGALNHLYVDMAKNREKRELANWFLQVTPDMLETGAGY